MTAATMPQDGPTKAHLLATVKGYLQARDPITQKVVWTVPHESSWNGGVLSPGGNLVFQGNAMGEVVAYGARTGEKLWSFDAQTGVAPAMSYQVKGEQYIAVVAGWGGAMPVTGGDVARKGAINVNRSRVLAFKLGGQATLPPPEAMPALPQPPSRIKDKNLVAAGKATYITTCGVCHGDAVVGSGLVPDLRYSSAIGNATAWKSIVLDGTLRDRGMVSFGPMLSPEDAEATRAYVIERANDLYDEAKAIGRKSMAGTSCNSPPPSVATTASTHIDAQKCRAP